MAHRDEKLEHLRQVPLFSQCSKRDLAHIARISDELDVKPGVALTKEGTRGMEFLLIIKGEAAVLKHEQEIARLGAGDYFGELSLLDGSPRSATVVAETPMELLVVHRRFFRALLNDTPGLAEKLLVSTARRLRDANPEAHTH